MKKEKKEEEEEEVSSSDRPSTSRRATTGKSKGGGGIEEADSESLCSWFSGLVICFRLSCAGHVTVTFQGKAPVDYACKQKIGKV